MAQMTKSKIFLFALLAFIAGVAVRSFLFMPYAILWIGAVGALIIFTLGTFRKNRRWWIFSLFAVSLLIGIFRYDSVVRVKPDISQLRDKSVVAKGVVWQEPEREKSVQRIKLRVTEIGGAEITQPFFILLTVRRYPQYKIGDALRFDGVIEQPQNFGEFDYISYLARNNVFALSGFPRIEKIGENKGPRLATLLFGIKNRFEKNINAVLPEPHASLLKGLTLGERAGLPEELVQDFRRTGTSHIVALSGYNITMIGRFIGALLMLLTVPFQLIFWMSASAIILFVLLTGASASVVRAGIMGILVLVAEKEGRLYQMRNALAFAAAVMIFHNPYVLRFDAGFQLSFVATIGLVYLSPHVARLLRLQDPLFSSDAAKSQPILPVRRVMVETISAQLAVLPLLIYLFGQVSLISPIVNVLVLMAVPYAMTVGFITGGLGLVSYFLSEVAGWINWILLEYILRLIEYFALIPLAAIRIGQWMIVPLAAVYAWLGWIIWKKSARI